VEECLLQAKLVERIPEEYLKQSGCMTLISAEEFLASAIVILNNICDSHRQTQKQQLGIDVKIPFSKLVSDFAGQLDACLTYWSRGQAATDESKRIGKGLDKIVTESIPLDLWAAQKTQILRWLALHTIVKLCHGFKYRRGEFEKEYRFKPDRYDP